MIGKVGENDQDKTGGKVAEVNVQDTQHEEQQELSFVSMSPSLLHLLVKLEISMLVSQGCENWWQNWEKMIENYLGIILGIGWHFPHP